MAGKFPVNHAEHKSLLEKLDSFDEMVHEQVHRSGPVGAYRIQRELKKMNVVVDDEKIEASLERMEKQAKISEVVRGFAQRLVDPDAKSVFDDPDSPWPMMRPPDPKAKLEWRERWKYRFPKTKTPPPRRRLPLQKLYITLRPFREGELFDDYVKNRTEFEQMIGDPVLSKRYRENERKREELDREYDEIVDESRRRRGLPPVEKDVVMEFPTKEGLEQKARSSRGNCEKGPSEL